MLDGMLVTRGLLSLGVRVAAALDAKQMGVFSYPCLPGYDFTLPFRRLVAGFPSRRTGFEPKSDHVGFVVDKVALGQIISEYFDFPCQFLFHRLLHILHHLSSGAGTVGQLVADVPSGLSLTPLQETKNYTILRVLNTSVI
jgi:hypothetical protein